MDDRRSVPPGDVRDVTTQDRTAENSQPIITMARRALVPALVGTATVFFAFCVYYYLVRKTAFFDDAFIYLHIAANIIDEGTARYYIPAGSEVFLASSPLKAYVLAAALWIASLLAGAVRSIAAAKAAFLVGGVLMSLAFVVFYRRRPAFALGWTAAFWALASIFDTMLQMEGGLAMLLSITVWTTVADTLRAPPGSRPFHARAALAGALLGLLVLARVEIALLAMVAAVFVLPRRAWPAAAAGGTAVALLHIGVAWGLLGVYPIPSTVWSKQVTGASNLFSIASFLATLPNAVLQYAISSSPSLEEEHIFNTTATTATFAGKTLWLTLLLPAVLICFVHRRFLLPFVLAGVFAAVYAGMPPNYAWYYQNLVVVLLVLLVLGATTAAPRSRAAAAVLFCAAGLLAGGLLSNRFLVNNRYPYDLDGPSRAQAYRHLAGIHQGEGVFRSEPLKLASAHLRICEIGMISYLAGNRIWLWDMCGLAQIGNLPGYRDSWARHLYPSGLAVDGLEEMRRLDGARPLPLWDAWPYGHIPVERCVMENGIACLSVTDWSTPAP